MDNDLISRSALLEELKERYNEARERENANYEWKLSSPAALKALCFASKISMP